MYDIYDIKAQLDNAKAELEEATFRDPIHYRKKRAWAAKRLIERAKLRLDLLNMANPGLTEHCKEIRDLYSRYMRYNHQIEKTLDLPSPIINDSGLFTALSEAEDAVMTALTRPSGTLRAMNSLNKVEMIFHSIKMKGHEIPDSFKGRLTALLGYSSQL